MSRWALVALLLLLLAATLGFTQLLHVWEEPLVIEEGGLVLNVPPGASLRTIAEELEGKGILRQPNLLIVYGRLTGADQSLRHGEYWIPEYTTPEYLLTLLQRGEVMQYQVTLPEGITLARAIEILRDEKQLQHVVESVDDPELLKLVEPYTNPEGWFFPDSYRYTRGASDLSILERARDAMRQVLQEEWHNRAEQLPYETPYEALTMASIVERETGLASERAEIAGVFMRRLHAGMRLQTDPTVIYGIGDAFDGNLRRSHLRDPDNLYNSYQHHGLPPSPIALPGRAAIHAALHPAPGDTLFFVARGDGGHVFSRTLAEHEEAVREYQLKRRQDYRSSPRRGN
ncbi:MAG: endolytic transglycosylase MltG [Halioglobus sp.]|nr:endolytic transglycosylase MltG [Halioglobus sp.]